ncbi:uncharacterized protein LOC122050537 [Zingiber officinale]|uniref:uncharacterized protein LOC122050537 n=1 Tax=Zingiber officinale TaxID=94328 RepID=UPI001C4CF55A|nr:uncharacterized protein LOC122050537 [Zingiber officinale]
MANTSTLSLRSILEKENILLGSNYLDWYRKLKIVLRHERKIYVLKDEPLKEPTPDASEEDQSYYSQYMEDALDVQCIILSSMSPELQRQHENMSAREIDQHLRKLFQESARVERWKWSGSYVETIKSRIAELPPAKIIVDLSPSDLETHLLSNDSLEDLVEHIDQQIAEEFLQLAWEGNCEQIPEQFTEEAADAQEIPHHVPAQTSEALEKTGQVPEPFTAEFVKEKEAWRR